MLTELHARTTLKNSHAYPATRFERMVGRRFCCAVKFVERNRDAVLCRSALQLTEARGRTHTKADVIRYVLDWYTFAGGWSLDERLAWHWYKVVSDKHRKFVVDEGFFCEGEG